MKNYILLFILCICIPLHSQEILTLEEAKKITLSNNFGIQIAQNNFTIAKNLTDKSVNGYLPIVTASAGLNGSLGGSFQKFSNGQEASTSNAFTWGTNATVGTNYTLLDKRRDLSLAQLKESLNLSNLELRQTIELNLFQVYSTYFQIAQLLENVNVLEEAISVSKERLRRSEYQLELGQGNGLNVLNAKVDIQRDSVNILNAKLLLNNAKRNLNIAMGRDPNIVFDIETKLEEREDLLLSQLLESAKKDNSNLQLNRQNLKVNEMNLQLIEAEKRPTVNVGASYNFNFTDNPNGAFFDRSNNQGLNANIGMNWTIFDGSRKIRKQNVVVGLANQNLQIEQLEQALEGDLLNAWSNYQNALFILKVEETAVQTNQENFKRTEEQFKYGKLTSIEFRQAQLNLLNAQTSLNNAAFEVKLREIELLQLAGKLIE